MRQLSEGITCSFKIGKAIKNLDHPRRYTAQKHAKNKNIFLKALPKESSAKSSRKSAKAQHICYPNISCKALANSGASSEQNNFSPCHRLHGRNISNKMVTNDTRW